MTGSASGIGGFVGRTDELARVRTVAGARGAVGRTLLVTGPNGSGKSSLLRAALGDFAGDLMWLSGGRSSGAEPWAALRNARAAVDAVEDFARSGATDLAAGAVQEGLAPAEVGRLVAERYRTPPRRARPAVVVADDLHRCDPYSLELLVFLAHRNHTFDVSYVLGCLDDELPDGLLDLDRVELRGLDAPAAREALSAWSGHLVALPVADLLVSRTDGNPLLLREAAAHLGPEQLEGRRALPVRLTASAASLAAVAPVLENLPHDELQTLASFALAREVPSVVLDGVSGPGPVGALLDRHLVEALPGGYRPSRAALGWLAEALLGPPARRALAAVLADAWRLLDPLRAALHAADAVGPGPEVVEQGRRALSRPEATADDQLAEALAWAVVGHADPPTTHDWLALTARAERAGHLLDARDAFEQAVRAPGVDEADLPELTRWRGFLSQVADDRTLAVPSTKLLSALELVRPAVVFETMTQTAWNSLLVGAHAQARSYLDRARQSSRAARPGDRALWRLVDVGWQRTNGSARGETLREAALRWCDSSEGRGWYDDFLVVTVLIEAGAHADARQHLFEAASAHRDAGRHAVYFFTAARMMLEVATYQVPAALRTASALEDLALPRPVHVRGLDPALVRLATLAGLPDGAFGQVRTSYDSEATALARAHAERLLVDGRYPEAAVGLQALVRRQPALPAEQRWQVLADLVEAQVAQGDLAAARRSADGAGLLDPPPGSAAVAARVAALVSSSLEARAAFAHALAVAESADGLVERGRTLLALARRLGPTEARPEAEQVRDEAALHFAHHGLEGWRRHASRLGWEAPPADARGRMLTTRLDDHESGIVSLLLLGHRNQDVADRLYVSLRSLEKSLTRIYAKLGVSSKAQMLTLVRGDGPTGPVDPPEPAPDRPPG